MYLHEMRVDDHVALAEVLTSAQGKVVLSGYPSELYRELYEEAGWHRVDIDIANHAAGGREKNRRCESLWMNFSPDASA